MMASVVRNCPAKVIEVQDASGRLGLSKELNTWNKEEVQKWILYAIREYYSVCLDLLEIEGKDLVKLNLSEFQNRVPDLAVFFFNELQTWKKATPGSDYPQTACSDPINKESPVTLPVPAYVTQHTADSPATSPRVNSNISDCNSPIVAPSESTEDVSSYSAEIPVYINDVNETPSPSPTERVTSIGEIQNETHLFNDQKELNNDSVNNIKENDQLKSPGGNSKLKLSIPTPSIVVNSPPRVSYPCEEMPSSASTPLPSMSSSFLCSLSPLLASHGSMLSPISPQVAGGRPRLFIPPPSSSGFPLPFQISPAFMPQSPFRSPLITPDLQSPHVGSLPHMEALRENILRLEKERQKHALSLDKSVQKIKKKRVKRASKNDLQIPNCAGSSKVNSSTESVLNTSVDAKLLESRIQALACKVKVEQEESLPGNSKTVVIDNNSNMKVISPRHHSIPSTEYHHSDLTVRKQLSRLNESAESLQNCNTSSPSGHRLDSKGYINIEPVNDRGKSPVTVRQNSYQIPYYQATSLQSLDRQTSEVIIQTADMRPTVVVDTLKPEQISPMNLSTSRPESATRDSYSPISSPSDTEVEGEHPFYQHQLSTNFPHPIYNLDGIPTSYSIQEGAQSPNVSSFMMQPQLLPSVLPNNFGNMEANVQPKSPKKRGRPPGIKPMQKPLGPTDIQNSFFKANHLWKFLLEMLEQPHQFGEFIHWTDRPHGVFKILNSSYVASLWGKRKNNGKMTYDKFSRSIRQYYKKGIIIKTKPSKLIYQFGAEFFNPNGE